MSAVHPFTRAGFGPAPFRCVRVTKEIYQACHGAPIQPGTSCDYCGTGIMYAYWIVNGDKSREFKVGCDCVMRAGAVVERFDVERKKLAREQSAARSHAKREARKAQREAENAERQRAFAIEREQRFNAFAIAEPAVISYLLNRTEGFLGEMNAAVQRWGSLTEGQLKAVKASMAREAVAKSSRHVGEIGKRIEGSYEIVKQTERDYGFPAGVRYWHLLKGADGNLCTYFGTRLGRVGELIKMRATVKAHEEYQGVLQTALARPSNVETISGGAQ